ncbi:4-hydroxybenzoate polyprenyl transferase, proteobacterial [Aurantiacibacter atlanticus]|uniref:4-hydroxybenzoate octaprenyltransferase n=1 Tax=Aurantiacibacter atlanticus TaxID=1648404 RepID=A0A0H4VFC9_9SPHN|nr:4-hydroxybenzoate octaprenyltransferase [Aurantiacibacter atlanticus]AKQ41784.1 4-hydroxybenzoate polyprenyl transferase, proteobacterial [Aurantiacibacter atlanticus]MDF1833748.1 4-hydroxybenzoate octaprenyltransferase [Alteraurantiacibacter sp. bin_em_oilr2.035]
MSAPITPDDTFTPDTQHRSLAERLPQPLRDYALLARFDRPIGWWLLFWPCAWGVWLTGAGTQWELLAWFLLGAVAMRSAGCVYNDIVDRDLDKSVARTANRPIASGRVSLRAAWAWLVVLCLIGLVVLLQLRVEAQLVALGSLVLVAAYPFMKRLTWWPQAWLGLVFTWGALVGWTALRSDNLAVMFALYIGAFFWCIGYDTIYALQDREDDALVGIKSSALRLGRHVKVGVALFYALAAGSWLLAFWLLRADWLALVALGPAVLHLAWQVITLEASDPNNPLARFRSNRFAGALMAAACFIVGNAGA